MTVQIIPHEQPLCTMTVHEPKPMRFGFLFTLITQTYPSPCPHGQAGADNRTRPASQPSVHSSQSSLCCAYRLQRSLLTGLLPRFSRHRRRSALPPRHFARRSRESVIVGNTLSQKVKRPAEESKQSGGKRT